jgi:hypothetical protein
MHSDRAIGAPRVTYLFLADAGFFSVSIKLCLTARIPEPGRPVPFVAYSINPPLQQRQTEKRRLPTA